MPRGRGRNKAAFKLRITGSIGAEPVDGRYVSLAEFLDRYGNDKTPYGITRSRIEQFYHKNGYQTVRSSKRTEEFRKHVKLIITPIYEPRDPVAIVKPYLPRVEKPI